MATYYWFYILYAAVFKLLNKYNRLAQDLNKSVDSCRIIIISSGFIESVGLRIDITFAKLHGILLINLILKTKKTLLTFKLSMNTVTHL